MYSEHPLATCMNNLLVVCEEHCHLSLQENLEDSLKQEEEVDRMKILFKHHPLMYSRYNTSTLMYTTYLCTVRNKADTVVNFLETDWL